MFTSLARLLCVWSIIYVLITYFHRLLLDKLIYLGGGDTASLQHSLPDSISEHRVWFWSLCRNNGTNSLIQWGSWGNRSVKWSSAPWRRQTSASCVLVRLLGVTNCVVEISQTHACVCVCVGVWGHVSQMRCMIDPLESRRLKPVVHVSVATSGCVSVQHGQQSDEPARRRGALHPQEQFIHRELPQVEMLWQRDLQTPPLGLSLTPLVPVSQNNRRRRRKIKGQGTMRTYWLGWVTKSCSSTI